MEHNQHSRLDKWSGSYILATIVDNVPDLTIHDGHNTVSLLYLAAFETPDDSGHTRNLELIRRLMTELAEYHSAYLAALHPESVSEAQAASVMIDSN